MTHSTKYAPAGAGTPAGAIEPVTHKIGDSPAMLDQDALLHEKVTCTGDVWCGCTCHACTVSFEHCDQHAVIVPALLAEADTLLPTLLASRLASASACFPAPEGGTVYVQSSGNRVNIAVTEKDPDSQQLVTREFTAELREVTA